MAFRWIVIWDASIIPIEMEWIELNWRRSVYRKWVLLHFVVYAQLPCGAVNYDWLQFVFLLDMLASNNVRTITIRIPQTDLLWWKEALCCVKPSCAASTKPANFSTQNLNGLGDKTDTLSASLVITRSEEITRKSFHATNHKTKAQMYHQINIKQHIPHA